MQYVDIFNESVVLAAELLAVVDLPLLDDSPRIQTSDVAYSLALEHRSVLVAAISENSG
jgi:hypothetical protein